MYFPGYLVRFPHRGIGLALRSDYEYLRALLYVRIESGQAFCSYSAHGVMLRGCKST